MPNSKRLPGRRDVDDAAELACVAAETLTACLPGSAGNQEALVVLGLPSLLADVLIQQDAPPAVHLAAANLLAELVADCPRAQARGLLISHPWFLWRLGRARETGPCGVAGAAAMS